MTKYFRIQTADRDPADLLDPGYQFSHAYNGAQRNTRYGVSACASLDELAEYLVSGLAGALQVRSGDWVIVELEGTESGAHPVDPEYELLVRPTRIVSITPVGAEFFQMMDEAEALLASFVDAPVFDEE